MEKTLQRGIFISVVFMAVPTVAFFNDIIGVLTYFGINSYKSNDFKKVTHIDEKDQIDESIKIKVTDPESIVNVSKKKYLINDNESIYVEFAKTNISVNFGKMDEVKYTTIGIYPDGEKNIKKAMFSTGSIKFARGNNEYILHILRLNDKSMSFKITNTKSRITIWLSLKK